MTRFHVVTDSAAHFVSPHFVEQNPLTVVPNVIEVDGIRYREGIDISGEEAVKLVGLKEHAPTVHPPSVADYVAVYQELAARVDAIISIHASREIFQSWNNAQMAAHQVGHSGIMVIDSKTLDAAQGMLIKVALSAIHRGETLDEVVRTVRGGIERIYAVYYVESLGYLDENKIMAASHVALGTMMGIKPFLTLEEGLLRPIEKVKSRSQAVERLLEFVIEFTDVEEGVILQSRTMLTEQTRTLQDRLALEFPDQAFPFVVYNPSLAALIGGDATGIVVLESKIPGDTEELYFDED